MKKILIVCCLLSLSIYACGEMSSDESHLPFNAKVYSNEGYGWVKFKLYDECFLYNKNFRGYKGYQAITKCDCE